MYAIRSYYEGHAMIVYGWTMAEDLVKLGAR